MESLPADVRRAYEVGLVTREDLNDLERSVTVGEAAGILQKAQTHRTGSESPVLADLVTHETFAQRNADRGWLLVIPALVDLEQAYTSRFESYEQWTQEVLKIWDLAGALPTGTAPMVWLLAPRCLTIPPIPR